MPSPSESPASNAARIVHLDCTSDDLALLLGLIENGGDRSDQWSELTRVLAVGARYQFQHIANFVRQPASHRIDGGNVKEIFNFAGSNGFHDLAKLAIAGFVNSSSMWNAEYDDLPLTLQRHSGRVWGSSHLGYGEASTGRRPHRSGQVAEDQWSFRCD